MARGALGKPTDAISQCLGDIRFVSRIAFVFERQIGTGRAATLVTAQTRGAFVPVVRLLATGADRLPIARFHDRVAGVVAGLRFGPEPDGHRLPLRAVAGTRADNGMGDLVPKGVHDVLVRAVEKELGT